MEYQGVLERRLIIVNNYGEKLAGLFHESSSTNIVVVCHGFICTKEQEVTEKLTIALQNGGTSAFRFDFSGNGESEGEFQYANYHKEVEHLRAVIEHFRIKENRKTTAIVGYSKGGNVVLLYASKYHDIDCVVNISGRYCMGKGIQKRLGKDYMQRMKRDGFVYLIHNGKKYLVTLESLNERLSIDMGEKCLSIDRNCRVVTIHGSADTVVYRKDVIRFDRVMAANENHRLHNIPGANHGYNDHQTDLAVAVLEALE